MLPEQTVPLAGRIAYFHLNKKMVKGVFHINNVCLFLNYGAYKLKLILITLVCNQLINCQKLQIIVID